MLVCLLTLVVCKAEHPKFTLEGSYASIKFEDEFTYQILNENNFAVLDSEENELLKLEEKTDGCEMELKRRMLVEGSLLGSRKSSFQLQSYEQWKLIVLEDFQNQISGWSDDSVNSCANSPDLFLGGHCKFSDATASKSFSLPSHYYILVKFNVHFFDRWEGESVFFKLDGETVWSESYTACTNLHSNLCFYKGIDVCGDEFPDRMGQTAMYSGFHTKEEVTLEFSSTLNRDSCEVSWAIDNIEIYVRN